MKQVHMEKIISGYDTTMHMHTCPNTHTNTRACACIHTFCCTAQYTFSCEQKINLHKKTNFWNRKFTGRTCQHRMRKQITCSFEVMFTMESPDSEVDHEKSHYNHACLKNR